MSEIFHPVCDWWLKADVLIAEGKFLSTKNHPSRYWREAPSLIPPVYDLTITHKSDWNKKAEKYESIDE
jgi:hypothetical protein